MAFVVKRSGGRYEIRESLQTEKGPRARTLLNFATLTQEALDRAAGRARTSFDRTAVVASAARRGAVVSVQPSTAPVDGASTRFVATSRRFAESLSTQVRDPSLSGDALIELIGFAEEVARHQPLRAAEPLRFPSLQGLARP
jgi:hypothetical protein